MIEDATLSFFIMTTSVIPRDYIVISLNDVVMHKGRFWELDLIRGAAVVMMVIFHLAYDLNFFGVYKLDIYSGFWFCLARITAGLFILLAGVSLVLIASKTGHKELPIKFFERGIKIFSIGLAITAATYLLIGRGFIIFGILHFIGLSIIIAYPFLGLKKLNVAIGIIIIAAGLYLQNLSFGSPWLLWLGLAPSGFYSVDYFPLLPWFGLILIGIYLGDVLYGGYRRSVELQDLSSCPFVKPIAFLGRNSLAIYLIHQPLLISALLLLGKASISIPLQ